MSFSFAIIGGGWYGCHIALSFRALGFDVTIFEQNNQLLHEASGNNQFRLHLGFHYPRHHRTRIQSRDGFTKFVERYPELSQPVADNIYAVPCIDSLIDFSTYKMIMTASGIDFRELARPPQSLANVEGCLLAPEHILLLDKARRYFTDRLRNSLMLGCRIDCVEQDGRCVRVAGQRFDFAIDATWGHLIAPPITVYYEPTVLLYHETSTSFPALTFVDGPLCSIYPTEMCGLFTLSSVPHTPLGCFATADGARRALAAVDRAMVSKKLERMQQQIKRYVPDFTDIFRFVEPQFAIKTKPVGKVDDRSCYVFRDGRVFSVLSGKIDTIFFAADRILTSIGSMDDGAPDPREMRSSIVSSCPATP